MSMSDGSGGFDCWIIFVHPGAKSFKDGEIDFLPRVTCSRNVFFVYRIADVISSEREFVA